MAAPREWKCLSPLAWRFGWLKSLFVVFWVIGMMIALRSRAGGTDSSLLPAFAGLAAILTAYLWPSKVTLGEDGLVYRRWGVAKFISYSRIRKTESIQRLGTGDSGKKSAKRIWRVFCGLRLHLDDGTSFDIGTGTEEVDMTGHAPSALVMGAYGVYGAFDRSGWELQQALDERIRVAREVSEVPAVAAGLLRGEKSVPQWLEAIKATLPERGGAYRGTDGTQEALWRVLEDESSPREARAGAALALRAHLDDEGRHRMRVVVEACESPKLRVAIETALDEEASEPRLLQALEQASLPRREGGVRSTHEPNGDL